MLHFNIQTPQKRLYLKPVLENIKPILYTITYAIIKILITILYKECIYKYEK